MLRLVSSLDLPEALPETCGVVCSFAQYDDDDDDDDVFGILMKLIMN